jgi:hypothetical protein
VGAWFIKAVWTKLTLAFLWGVIPYPTVSPRFLAFQPFGEAAAGQKVWTHKFP